MKRTHLTETQRDLLARAAEFVLAGEWPWSGDEATIEREHAALERAAAIVRSSQSVLARRWD